MERIVVEEKNIIVSHKMRIISWLASITIVMLHAGAYFKGGSEGAWNTDLTMEMNIIGFLHFIGTMSMGWFFFTSSYFFFLKYDWSKWGGQLKKRIMTLMVPYLAWNAIMLLYNILLEMRVGKLELTYWEIIKSFIFFYCPGVKMLAPINLPLWYIIRIFTYFLTAPIIFQMIKKKKTWLISEILLLGMIYLLKIEYYSFFYWLPAFLLGAGIAEHYKEKFQNYILGNVKNNYNWILLMVYILICFFAFVFQIDVTIRRYGGIFLIFCMLHHMKVSAGEGKSFSQASFLIYCSHFIILNLLVRLLHMTNLFSGSLIQYVCLIFVTVIIAEIMLYILKRWFIPGCKVFLGGR